MKTSVIISVYNEEKYIEKCLLSLQKQTLKDFEIIVIDDGSTDNTYNIVSNFQFPISNFQLIKQKHQGPAVARNKGSKIAKGEILVFVDGDMYFDKDFFQNLVKPIKKGLAKGTFSIREYVANWDNVWARCWNYNWGLKDRKRIIPDRVDQIKDFRAILKEEFNRVNGFDNIGYTDTWTLSEKLNYVPIATKALCFHYNPASLGEVFNQAEWVAKRKYKLGLLGKIVALVRANFFISLANGFKGSFLWKEPSFLLFKLIYDFGATLGILMSFKSKKA